MIRISMAAIALCTIAACGPTAPVQPTTDQGSVDPAQATQPAHAGAAEPVIDAPLPTDAWVGEWIGVEGLKLDIARGEAPGTYRLTILLMDGTETHDGTADGGRIKFERGGSPAYVRKASGAETGLKWLAEKTDCLMIQPGEGFCRG